MVQQRKHHQMNPMEDPLQGVWIVCLEIAKAIKRPQDTGETDNQALQPASLAVYCKKIWVKLYEASLCLRPPALGPFNSCLRPELKLASSTTCVTPLRGNQDTQLTSCCLRQWSTGHGFCVRFPYTSSSLKSSVSNINLSWGVCVCGSS